jgi:anti-sigma B factor antagonist
MADPALIVLEGELDLHAARELAPRLDAAAAADFPLLVVDLAAVTFLDSTGLGAILQAHQRLRRQGRAVKVVVPPGSAAAVTIDLAGLRSVLTLCPSRAAALGEGTLPQV